MTVLRERDLEFTVPDGVHARKFDSDYGMSHCMKAVDFILELDDRYLFIEFKDPQHPKAPVEELEDFTENFQRGRIDEELKYKYRDSFLYEWASGRADKPIYYLVLVGLDDLTPDELDAKTDDLKQKLPLDGPNSAPWSRPFVRGCAVFNIASWNRNLPQYPVSRRSSRP